MNAIERRRETVTLSTGTISYEVAGSGRPVVWLHPAGGVHWSPVHHGLARSFTLYVPALPGFDPKLAGEFIDRAIGTSCDVVGGSAGGWLAAWLAVLRPALVEHLVLEAPRPRESDDGLLARLNEIEAVTLLLRGTADPLVTDESVQLQRSRLRRGYLLYVWDAGHTIDLDQPERMLRAVESFLQRSDAFIVNWETAAIGA